MHESESRVLEERSAVEAMVANMSEKALELATKGVDVRVMVAPCDRIVEDAPHRLDLVVL